MILGPHVIHTTVAGERWDNLAWKYYGDAYRVSPIIEANPDVEIMDEFTAGISIRVPILDAVVSRPPGLPPWVQ